MKFTVLGAAGRMGAMHAKHLKEMGHFVVPVDSADKEMIPDFRFPGAAMGCDGIVIATPADCHALHLSQAIGAGLHVFIEKPICLIKHIGPARVALHEAGAKGLVVSVGYNLRFHPMVMLTKSAIAAGNCKPLWGSFILRQKPKRPLAHFLEEWASHEVDLALHLFGPCGDVKLLDYSPTLIRFAMSQWNKRTSFVLADAETEPFVRAFTIVFDEFGSASTFDIEKNHVQQEHYKQELAAWVDRINWRNDPRQRSEPPSPLATGEEGLAVIELLERVTK